MTREEFAAITDQKMRVTVLLDRTGSILVRVPPDKWAVHKLTRGRDGRPIPGEVVFSREGGLTLQEIENNIWAEHGLDATAEVSNMGVEENGPRGVSKVSPTGRRK